MNSNFKPLIFRFLYMRFKGDISGLDELQERIDDAYFSVLSEVGRNATRNAKNQKTFQNRTGNLANANGGCVVRNGQIYSEKPKDGLYLANGMEYASYVESKGFEVILTNGVLFAERNINKKLNIK